MLPTIPTDNLFKFLAISGVILTGFCIWLPNDVESRLRTNETVARDQYVEFISDVEAKLNAILAEADLDATEEQKKKVLKLYVVVPDPNGNPVLMKPGTVYPLAIEAKYRDGYRRVLTYWDDYIANSLPHAGQSGPIFTPDEVKALRTKLRQHNIALENLWRQTDGTAMYRAGAFWGVVAGIVMSLAGFGFWLRHDLLANSKIKEDKKDLEGSEGEKDASSAQPNEGSSSSNSAGAAAPLAADRTEPAL